MQWQQVRLAVKVLSPEKSVIGMGRWYLWDQQATVPCAAGRAQGTAPGSKAASSLTWRPGGNQGDPAVGVGKRDAPSDKCKKRGGGQRQPEVGGIHKSDEAW